MKNEPRATFAAASPPRGRRVVGIVWLFVCITILVLAAAVQGIGLLSASRAYVNGESSWSKAQKDAVFHLTRYGLGRDERDYRAYLADIAVPLGDSRARLELEKADPDLQAVREGFLAGRNHPDDIDGMIAFYRFARDFGPVAEAIRTWREADFHVAELVTVGETLHREIAAGRLTGEHAQVLLTRVDALNAALTPLEVRFSQSLGEAQRQAQRYVLVAMLAFSTLLLLGGIVISQRIVGQAEALERAVRDNEAQLRALIEKAPLALMIVRMRDEAIVYANPRALEQFGLTPAQARARRISDFYPQPGAREKVLEIIERERGVRDYEIELQDQAGRRFWVLLSAQRMRFGGEECLISALHNIDERRRMQDDMRHRAFHDALTGLPNRSRFLEALAQALKGARRNESRVGVLFIDLDRFKVVNDTLGHVAGDRLLQAAALRLRAGVRENDLVARLGGDEFVIVTENHGGPEDLGVMGEKILAQFERPFVLDWREVSLTASIGIASFPDDGDDVDTLVKNADIAMYQAKEQGRNACRYYSPSKNHLTLQRFDLEARLRGALEREEFVLHYQPMVNLSTGQVEGLEALIRWQDPSSGLVMPADFIPLAEETGTIIAIGHWVLRRACQDLARWRSQGVDDVHVAVNISARQFLHHELVNEVFQALQAEGIPPQCLELEITESMMMVEPAAAETSLRALHGLGVRIAVDDFGTGYSSLSLIRRFPIDVVKVDRSFVAGCPDDRECMAIVKSVTTLAASLDLQVVAEGVETGVQRVAVAAAGCTHGQGYHFSRPVEAARVVALCREALPLVTANAE